MLCMDSFIRMRIHNVKCGSSKCNIPAEAMKKLSENQINSAVFTLSRIKYELLN